jgi:RNA polymerase sigma factor (sigma-70 family)
LPRQRSLDPQPQTRSDEDLFEGLRRPTRADFNALYERYFQRVYSFAFARLRNRADTEEVVQETFTAVFRSIDAYRGQSTLLCWIYGIAKNNVNNHLRRAKAHDLRVERAAAALVVGAATLDVHPGRPAQPAALRSGGAEADVDRGRLASRCSGYATSRIFRSADRTARLQVNDAVRSTCIV